MQSQHALTSIEPDANDNGIRSWSLRGFVLAACLACAALIGLFLFIGEEVVLDGRNRLDHTISLRINDYASSDRTAVVRLITDLGSSAIAAVICTGIVGWLVYRRRYSTAVVILLVFGIAKLLETGLKLGFERTRPTLFPHLTEAGGYSFPSGHTMTAVITYGLLAVIAADHLRGRSRLIPPLMAVLIVVAVGFSRIYLGVHYLTDVVAGILVAGPCLIVAILALNYFDRSRDMVAAARLPIDPRRR